MRAGLFSAPGFAEGGFNGSNDGHSDQYGFIADGVAVAAPAVAAGWSQTGEKLLRLPVGF